MNVDLVEATHGGNMQSIALRYGIDPAALLDFSANINPLGPPPSVVAALAELANDPQRLTAYPDPTAQPLRVRFGERFGVESDYIAVGNGAAAVLQAAFRVCDATRCVLPVPAFSEYRRIASTLGFPIAPIVMTPDFSLDVEATVGALVPGSLLALSNPHNPSGALLTREAMERLIDRCEERRAAIVIDEAFIDYAPDETAIARALQYDRAIVVRSLTKFYAIPGIRVGYAVSRMAPRLRDHLPCWPVGVCDIAAATAALEARDYERETIATNATAREALASGLTAKGITVFPSSANFILAELPVDPSSMDAVLEGLIKKQGIVVRDCRDYDTLQGRALIRIAVRSVRENQRLIAALTDRWASET